MQNMKKAVLLAAGAAIAPMPRAILGSRVKMDASDPKALIEQIQAAGIKIVGCAQAMMKNSIDPTDLNPNITPIFSRFTTVSTYQMKGYAYFRF